MKIQQHQELSDIEELIAQLVITRRIYELAFLHIEDSHIRSILHESARKKELQSVEIYRAYQFTWDYFHTHLGVQKMIEKAGFSAIEHVQRANREEILNLCRQSELDLSKACSRVLENSNSDIHKFILSNHKKDNNRRLKTLNSLLEKVA
ncbi:hypothetical protein N6H18_00875 [Reichenbachiella agarivorans]|uniref:DUF2383 domain-containing protein n=1 Tax=Reichenbachiella agarivorans TaxID=2979464 RepID=A0ABY6CPS6_9BACT|nr:hypothetical protein [Reichenbachiella agarivorans]UXP32529.1 hypothetical protein N6H18_00875 [Reichenbachiella agarivorans]